MPGVLDDPDLRAWWILNDGEALWPTYEPSTPHFCFDSGPHHNDLTATNDDPHFNTVWLPAGNPALPLTHQAPDPTGGGSVKFRLYDFQWISWGYNIVLSAPWGYPEGWTMPPDIGVGIGTGTSLSWWAAFVPPEDAVHSMPPYTGPGTPINGIWPHLFGCWGHEFGIGSWGTQAGFNAVTGEFGYFAQNSDYGYGPEIGASHWEWFSPALAPYEWAHFTSVVDKIDDDLYRRRFFFNFELDAELIGSREHIRLAIRSPNWLTLGGSWSDDIRFAHSAGMLSNFSVWDKPYVPLPPIPTAHTSASA